MRITKKQALRIWNSLSWQPFENFEAYWKECEEINAMSEADYQVYKRQVLESHGIDLEPHRIEDNNAKNRKASQTS